MDMHVVVLGAGSTGLLIAQGLKKNGISFTIYERDDEYKYCNNQRDWSMALLWGTHYLENTIPKHLLERFDEIKSDPHDTPGPDRIGTLPFYNGKTGELVAKIPGGVAVRVNREKLRKFLSDDLEIQFGKVSTQIEEVGDKIKVTFADGTTAIADTVVCADGIKGVGRRTLLGEEKAALSEAPCSFVNICNKYKPEQARFIRDTLDTMYKFGAHPDQPTLFMIVPVDIPDLDKPEDWKYQTCLSTWGAKHSDSNEERVRVFKEAASKYAEPWKSAAQWLSDDTYIPPDTIKYWANPEIWPNWNGKVTLAGDGAHPIVPFRAQGLNNALQDAHNYVQALVAVREGKQTLGDAITEYGNEVLERGAAENKLSNMWGPVLHNWQAIMNTPMMKQGYGQTKKPEAAEEAKKDEKEAQSAGETKVEEQSKPEQSSPASSESSTLASKEADSPNDEAPASSEPSTAGSIDAESPKEKIPASSSSTESSPAATAQPAQEATKSSHAVVETPTEKPTLLTAPVLPATTIAHGQYTPTEEHKSPDLKATYDAPLTPHEATEDELNTLRKENESLKRRNSLLMEKLRAIQALVTVSEVGVDEV